MPVKIGIYNTSLPFCYSGNRLVKIRYNMNAVLADVSFENDKTSIKFKQSVLGVTKGQACVVYSSDDGHLIGGGWI